MAGVAEPPPQYVCPISLEVMRNPVLVLHGGKTYSFDRRSLELHAQTKFKNKNPLTNLGGFSEAMRIPNDRLREEIEKSAWAHTTETEAERGDLEGGNDTETDNEEDEDFLERYVMGLMQGFTNARRRLFPHEQEEAQVPESIAIRIAHPPPEGISAHGMPAVFVRQTRRALYFVR